MEVRSFPALANTGDPNGPLSLSANEIACALISMMARSNAPNQRPNTLMQDRSPPTRQGFLATYGRTIHWVKSATSAALADVRFAPARSTGQCNTACSLSAGVWKPKVFRGR